MPMSFCLACRIEQATTGRTACYICATPGENREEQDRG